MNYRMAGSSIPVAFITAAALYFASANVLFNNLLPELSDDIPSRRLNRCYKESYLSALFGATSMIVALGSIFTLYLQKTVDIFAGSFLDPSTDVLLAIFSIFLLMSVVAPLGGIIIVSGTLYQFEM